jgi:hypothetical protein
LAEQITVRGASVKIRRPWGVFLLAVVTLGVYYLVWYYKVNRELRDFGRSFGPPNQIEVDPAMAVIAITLGSLIVVPPFVSMYRTFKRIGMAEDLADTPDQRVSPGIGFLYYLIAVIFLPVELPYAQSHLNRVWRH